MSAQVHSESTTTPETVENVTETPQTGAESAPSTPAAEPGADTGKEPGAAEAGAKGTETPPEVQLDADGKPIPPAFTPREKFKAWREEHEVPKWIRDLVKDPDTETKAIQLLEKAQGLDIMKPKFEETKQELGSVRGELSNIHRQVDGLRKDFQRGDIDAWLAKMQVPAERMLQWALDKVQYSQLPPDQQRILDERAAAQRRAYQLEEQVGEQGQQFIEQQRATLAVQLESGLTRPDVQTFAEAFDAKAGKPGAFRQEVISIGESTFHRSQGKTLLSPDQAIQAAQEKYRNFVGTPAAQSAPTGGAQQPGAARVVVPSSQAAATIPNVQGKGGTSPMKTQPTSIADLRKLAENFNGNR